MKKLMIVALALAAVMPAVVFADEIHGYIQVGYINELETYNTDMNISYDIWILSVFGSISVLMERNTITFSPFSDTYELGAKLNITDNVYLIGEHYCTHPVWSRSNDYFQDKWFTETQTQFSVGLEW